MENIRFMGPEAENSKPDIIIFLINGLIDFSIAC